MQRKRWGGVFFGPSKEQNIDKNLLDDKLEEEKEDEDEEQKERKEILKEDPVAKWQFAYNENNMYAIEMPESTATNEDKRNYVFFASGEKKIPKGFVQVFLRHMWHICQNTAYAVHLSSEVDMTPHRFLLPQQPK